METVNFDNVTGGANPQRTQKLTSIMKKLSAEEISLLRLEECTDERTGARYGQAKCRVGRCSKLGSGGRNRGSNYSYQIWAVWS